MFIQILKTVLGGILVGIALFMLPFFLLKGLIFCMLIAAAFRLFAGRRDGYRYAYAHKYKNMTDEERANFQRQCGYHHHGWNNGPENVSEEKTTNQ